jgi:hypothetical protein
VGAGEELLEHVRELLPFNLGHAERATPVYFGLVNDRTQAEVLRVPELVPN